MRNRKSASKIMQEIPAWILASERCKKISQIRAIVVGDNMDKN